MRKYFLFFVLLFSVFTPLIHVEAVTSSTGFIPGNIWYSTNSFEEGDMIKIYTGLWNNDPAAISTKVEFYNKNVLLGSREVVVPSLQLKEVSISWKVTSGDHLISAKIIPPTIIANSKKEIIISNLDVVSASRIFIPTKIKTAEGGSINSSDIIKNEIDKVTTSISSLLPPSVSDPIVGQVGIIDSFRVDTLEKISSSKNEVQKEINMLDELEKKNKNINIKSLSLDKNIKVNDSVVLAQTKSAVEDSTQKPIAYIKLFLLSALYFIFGSKLVFYLLIAITVFFILRFLYHKIRNK